MKLELKHLAGYLPYELKIQRFDGIIFNVTDSIYNLPNALLINFKPILRPLSDLTKDEFYSLWSHENDYESIEQCSKLDCESFLKINFSLYFWNEIYENHFDIYGLIEKGLAIDINTLEK